MSPITYLVHLATHFSPSASESAIKTPLFVRNGVFVSQSTFPPAWSYGMELCQLLLYFAFNYHDSHSKSTTEMKLFNLTLSGSYTYQPDEFLFGCRPFHSMVLIHTISCTSSISKRIRRSPMRKRCMCLIGPISLLSAMISKTAASCLIEKCYRRGRDFG
jgi:hypothetical protein